MLDLEPIKDRLSVPSESQWHADMSALVAEVEGLRQGLAICKRSAELQADLLKKRARSRIETEKFADSLLRMAKRAEEALNGSADLMEE